MAPLTAAGGDVDAVPVGVGAEIHEEPVVSVLDLVDYQFRATESGFTHEAGIDDVDGVNGDIVRSRRIECPIGCLVGGLAPVDGELDWVVRTGSVSPGCTGT